MMSNGRCRTAGPGETKLELYRRRRTLTAEGFRLTANAEEDE